MTLKYLELVGGVPVKKPHFRAYFIYFFNFSLIFLNLFRSWSQFKADSRQPILLLGKVNKSDEFPKTQNYLIKRQVYQIKLEIVEDNSRTISLSFIKEIIIIFIITIITYITFCNYHGDDDNDFFYDNDDASFKTMMMTNNQDDEMRMGKPPTIAARRPFSYNIETKSTAAVAEPYFAD